MASDAVVIVLGIMVAVLSCAVFVLLLYTRWLNGELKRYWYVDKNNSHHHHHHHHHHQHHQQHQSHRHIKMDGGDENNNNDDDGDDEYAGTNSNNKDELLEYLLRSPLQRVVDIALKLSKSLTSQDELFMCGRVRYPHLVTVDDIANARRLIVELKGAFVGSMNAPDRLQFTEKLVPEQRGWLERDVSANDIFGRDGGAAASRHSLATGPSQTSVMSGSSPGGSGVMARPQPTFALSRAPTFPGPREISLTIDAHTAAAAGAAAAARNKSNSSSSSSSAAATASTATATATARRRRSSGAGTVGVGGRLGALRGARDGRSFHSVVFTDAELAEIVEDDSGNDDDNDDNDDGAMKKSAKDNDEYKNVPHMVNHGSTDRQQSSVSQQQQQQQQQPPQPNGPSSPGAISSRQVSVSTSSSSTTYVSRTATRPQQQQQQQQPPPLTKTPSAQFRLKSALIFLDKALVDLHTWDFDIYDYEASCLTSQAGIEPLVGIGFSILHRFHLLETLNIAPNTVFAALHAIAMGYRDVPFHNQLHGADVCQSVAIFLHETRMWQLLDPHELLTILMAALCHDYDHPGVNNAFLTRTNHPLAMLYNDVNVLEMHHASSALQMFTRPETNVFATLEPTAMRSSRQLFISLVLATDLKHHFEIVNEFKVRSEKMAELNGSISGSSIIGSIEDLPDSASFRRAFTAKAFTRKSPSRQRIHSAAVSRRVDEASPHGSGSGDTSTTTNNNKGSGGDLWGLLRRQQLDSAELLILLKMCMKCADLGHPAKRWPLHVEWTKRVTEEMFRQGDQEAALHIPVSPFMDRSQDVSARIRSQLGFFSFLVTPMWTAFTQHFHQLRPCTTQLESNQRKWQSLAENLDTAAIVLLSDNNYN